MAVEKENTQVINLLERLSRNALLRALSISGKAARAPAPSLSLSFATDEHTQSRVIILFYYNIQKTEYASLGGLKTPSSAVGMSHLESVCLTIKELKCKEKRKCNFFINILCLLLPITYPFVNPEQFPCKANYIYIYIYIHTHIYIYSVCVCVCVSVSVSA